MKTDRPEAIGRNAMRQRPATILCTFRSVPARAALSAPVSETPLSCTAHFPSVTWPQWEHPIVHVLRASFVVALASAVWGCGTETSSTRAGSDAGLDPDAPPIIDALDDAGDAPPLDAPPLDAPDEGSADAAPPLGAPGDPCRDDADCDANLCVDIVAGDDLDGFCSRFCTTDDDCPRDFDCVFLAGEWDTQRICLPVDLCVDADEDGYGAGPGCDGADCDDDEPRAHAGSNEVCDGIDNDCDGVIDDDPVDANDDCETGFPGACASGRTVCEGGLLVCGRAAAPSEETCDNVDNDCDGVVDEDDAGEPLSRPCYDGDPALIGTGICAWGLQTCADGGYSGCVGQQLPQPETCDALDNDCDGTPDDGLVTADYYADADGDGFGDPASDPIESCARPAGFIENFSDCDDSSDAVRPGAAEIPGDGVDQNCDGSEFCFEDTDRDGYRPASAATVVSLDADCDDDGEAPATAPAGDCDDDDDRAWPGNPEVCDDVDNDCDRRVDEGAGCYPNGDDCVDPIDCASGLCEDAVCVRPLTCVDLGTCPPRLSATAGGGRLATGRFQLEIGAGAGTSSPVLRTSRYRLTVGSAPYVNDP